MRYIYCDVGAYDGGSLRQFMKRRKLPVKPEQFKLYAFEPNPNFHKKLEELSKEILFTLDKRAVWISYEPMKLALDNTKTPYGSSLMNSKQDYDNFEKIEVDCVDFSDWVRQFKDDYLVVKMDCEGAEFKILPKMLNEGTHKFMDELWLETHPNKVRDYTTIQSNALFKKLRQDIYVQEWA